MSESKIPLFKMKDLILILCFLHMSVAVPVFPQQSGIPGMASLSLETMRQLGSLQGLNTLSQFSRFGFGKSFNSLWMNGLLPQHSSFPWMRPREHETQQYEYSLPVHPPPLPSQPSLQPQQAGLKPFLQPTAANAIQATEQKGGPQPPAHLGQLPLQEGELPAIQQPAAPSDKPPKPEVLPCSQVRSASLSNLIKKKNNFQGVSSARLPPAPPLQKSLYPPFTEWSSPAQRGGRGGPMAYGAMFPGFGAMRPSFGGLPHNPGMGGDFTLEFDSPLAAATKGPEKGEGGAQDSPILEANPANPENPALLPELAPDAHTGLLAFPEDIDPSLARGPAGQRMGPPSVTPAAADPLMTPELADVYETYGADMTTPLEAVTDTTMTPDPLETSVPGDKAQQPQIVHDAWHFQEP
nr:ameloblastin [Microcebus murinus]